MLGHPHPLSPLSRLHPQRNRRNAETALFPGSPSRPLVASAARLPSHRCRHLFVIPSERSDEGSLFRLCSHSPVVIYPTVPPIKLARIWGNRPSSIPAALD